MQIDPATVQIELKTRLVGLITRDTQLNNSSNKKRNIDRLRVPTLLPSSITDYGSNIRFSCADKTEQDMEREQSLVDQWVSLTEERNAVLVPAAGSGIPGAPADWNPPPGMEPHIPVLFLDLNGTPESFLISSRPRNLTTRSFSGQSLMILVKWNMCS